MMDISDGIGSDLMHILEASEMNAEVDLSALPLSLALKHVCARFGWDPLELAVCGGEDYELLFTCTSQAEMLLTVPHFVIGRITDRTLAQPQISWRGASSSFAGFDHFRKH
jgi:thiamine-monophosphate kinase